MKYIVSVNTYGITHRRFGEFSTLYAAERTELDSPELLNDNELAEIKRDFDVQDILDDLQTHEILDIKNYVELMLAIKYNDSFVTPKEKEDVEMTLIYSIKNATKTADEKMMKCFDKLTECPGENNKEYKNND